MRVTGNNTLDPDFSKMIKHTQVLGSVPRVNMYASNSEAWLLPRINPVCENCSKNQTYHIVMSYYRIFPLIKLSKTHHIICSSCGEKIELELQEYLMLKPVMIRE